MCPRAREGYEYSDILQICCEVPALELGLSSLNPPTAHNLLRDETTYPDHSSLCYLPTYNTMAQPRTDEEISQEILDELSSTAYAYSSLERLSGGVANYVFRGTLTTPLPDGTKEVAVKHTESALARVPKWSLPTARCVRRCVCF